MENDIDWKELKYIVINKKGVSYCKDEESFTASLAFGENDENIILSVSLMTLEKRTFEM